VHSTEGMGQYMTVVPHCVTYDFFLYCINRFHGSYPFCKFALFCMSTAVAFYLHFIEQIYLEKCPVVLQFSFDFGMNSVVKHCNSNCSHCNLLIVCQL